MDDDFEAFLAAPLSDDDDSAPKPWQQRLSERRSSAAVSEAAATAVRDNETQETVVTSKSRWLKPKATSSLAATLPTAPTVQPTQSRLASTLKPSALLNNRPSRFLTQQESSNQAPDSLSSTIGSSFLSNTQPDLASTTAAVLHDESETLNRNRDAPAELITTQDSLNVSHSKLDTSEPESFPTLASSTSSTSSPLETRQTPQAQQEVQDSVLPSRSLHEPRLSAVQLADSFDSDLLTSHGFPLTQPHLAQSIPEQEEPLSSDHVAVDSHPDAVGSYPDAVPQLGSEHSPSVSSHQHSSNSNQEPGILSTSHPQEALDDKHSAPAAPAPDMQTFDDFLDNFDTSAGSTLKSVRADTPSDVTAYAGTTDKSSVAADTPTPALPGLMEQEASSTVSTEPDAPSSQSKGTLSQATLASGAPQASEIHVTQPPDTDIQSSRSRIPRYAGLSPSTRSPSQSADKFSARTTSAKLRQQQQQQPEQQLEQQQQQQLQLLQQHHLDDLLQQRLRSMQARLDAMQADPNLVDRRDQLDELSAAVAKQDTMLGAYEMENKHLYAQLQAARGGQASDVIVLQSELERAQREAFQLRSANEQLTSQLSGAGTITNQRCQQLQLQLDAEQAAHHSTRDELKKQLQQAQHKFETVQSELQASLAKKDQQLVLLTAETTALKQSLDEAQAGLLGLKAEYDKLRAKSKSTGPSDSGVVASAPEPAVAMSVRARAEQKSQEMARLLQPDATSTVVELVAANYALRKELDEQRREHDAELTRRQAQLSKLHADYSEVKQDYQGKVAKLSDQVTKLTDKQEHRPHSRVKELQTELELIQNKYTALLKAKQDESSADLANDIKGQTKALEADLEQAQAAIAQWQQRCQDLEAELNCWQGRFKEAQLQEVDVQARLDTALQLAEQHRRNGLEKQQQASMQQRRTDQALADSRQQAAQLEAKVTDQESALATAHERLESLHQQLADAPSPSVVLAYERQLRQLESDKHGLELELDQAQKYQTPTMQHFNLLQRRITQLESHHRERERSLKHLLVEQERAAALDRQEVESKWQQRLMDEATRVNALESELQGLMGQLRQLQRAV
eukprot:m.138325 g.138325  ORF g.138325 m.138325 type:complete len:1081 (+) comp16070_c1_seq2:116-3358(+)